MPSKCENTSDGNGRMADKHYENFDIHIGKIENGAFSIRVISTETGAQTRKALLLPSPLEKPEFSDVVDYIHDLVANQQDAKTLGEKLRTLLFPDEVWDLFNQRYGVTQAAGKRLRLRLQFDSLPLSCLPWELCYFDTHDSFFALLPQTPLIRYLAEPFAEGEITAVPTPIKVLVAAFNPRQDLQIEAEIAGIKAGLDELENVGRVEVISLPNANLVSLQKALDDQKPHVLHFIGHGEQGKLLLTAPNGQEALVPVDYIRSMIRIAATESLKVVVLNACHTAAPDMKADERASTLGVAQAILREGVPAVVAMQTVLPDKMAQKFAYKLYDQLAQGSALDEAVTQMRLEAHRIANQDGVKPEWGGYFGCMPVLFMRDSG